MVQSGSNACSPGFHSLTDVRALAAVNAFAKALSMSPQELIFDRQSAREFIGHHVLSSVPVLVSGAVHQTTPAAFGMAALFRADLAGTVSVQLAEGTALATVELVQPVESCLATVRAAHLAMHLLALSQWYGSRFTHRQRDRMFLLSAPIGLNGRHRRTSERSI